MRSTRAINEATGDEADLPTSGFTIALPAGDNAGLIATVLPLVRGEPQGGAFAGMVAIFVQDPIVMPPFPGEAFAELYGLTRSELRVLLAMVPGLSVKEAAEMLGIGENDGQNPPATHSLEDRHFEADRAHAFVHEFHTAGQRNRLLEKRRLKASFNS